MRAIPVKRIPLILSVPLALVACALAHFAPRLTSYYAQLIAEYPGLKKPLADAQLPYLVTGLAWFAAACGVILLATFIVGLIRKPFALWLVNKGYFLVYILAGLYAFVVIRLTGELPDAKVQIDGADADVVRVFYWRWDYLWPAGAVVVVLYFLHRLMKRRQVVALYGGNVEGMHEEDEEKRIGARDVVFRRSVFSSLAFHVAIIVVIPWIMQSGGCVEDYLVPGGSGGGGGGGGGPKAAVVKIMRAKQAKKKKYVLRPNSAIYFHVPDLDESQVTQDVEKSTEVQYTADRNDMVSRAEGGTGSGTGSGSGSGSGIGTGGGKGGGWPEGSKNAIIRFIRLEYHGVAWDDGMDAMTRADLNFLTEFKKMTGFKVADHSESNVVGQLRKYRKGYAPPFLYMTGEGGIDIPSGDVRGLREFLLDGSMLFVDCGSPAFDGAFRAFAGQLFPGERLVEIADDDPIFQQPNVYPNGFPPLWHHGGTKCMGIKHDNRWVVFYYPGDMNDAWKTGHNGVDPKLAKESYEMGVNLVYYSFTRYVEATRKYRK